ncbi:hypothetical protein EB151_04210 [archaeon]|nr:hypothetical protein [archaeon]
MNLKDKLKGLPPIILATIDERPDKREYAETQYDYWGIKDYTVVSGSKYQLSTYEDYWKDLVILNPFPEGYKRKNWHIAEISITVAHLVNIKNWLETTNDPYVIIMEDDYDLSFIEHWHFDWEYLMNNIPYDWDCIQMSFENEKLVPCFLHPILSGHDTGASLINRRYAEKIIQNIDRKKERTDLEFSYKAYQKWWTELRDEYTLEEFFTYGKPNDRIIVPREFENV